MNKVEIKNINEPFITVNDIMVTFSCGKDKAEEIMNNPDLKKFPVGKTYYVTRELYETFLNNLATFNGLRDLSHGFQMTTGYTSDIPKEVQFLFSIGFTPKEIAEVIYAQKEKRG